MGAALPSDTDCRPCAATTTPSALSGPVPRLAVPTTAANSVSIPLYSILFHYGNEQQHYRGAKIIFVLTALQPPITPAVVAGGVRWLRGDVSYDHRHCLQGGPVQCLRWPDEWERGEWGEGTEIGLQCQRSVMFRQSHLKFLLQKHVT